MSTLSFPTRRLAPDVVVAPQLEPADMAEAARAGFLSVINNRPDFEHDRDQPTSADIERAAVEAGMTYRFQPVDSVHHSAEDIATFAALLAELPRPILVFCRSGARSTRLFQAAQQAG